MNSPHCLNLTVIARAVSTNMDSYQLFPREFFGWRLSRAEERANAITHGLGFLLSLVGQFVMALNVFGDGDVWREVGCGVYVVSLLAVYAMSTLSHSATR